LVRALAGAQGGEGGADGGGVGERRRERAEVFVFVAQEERVAEIGGRLRALDTAGAETVHAFASKAVEDLVAAGGAGGVVPNHAVVRTGAQAVVVGAGTGEWLASEQLNVGEDVQAGTRLQGLRAVVVRYPQGRTVHARPAGVKKT
jgi:hypothetical protein